MPIVRPYIIDLEADDYAVLKDYSNRFSPEALQAFNGAKLRLEKVLYGQEIDPDTEGGVELYAYALFQTILKNVAKDLSDPRIPPTVLKSVSQYLSKLDEKFPFGPTKKALGYRFPRGCDLAEALYGCGYAEWSPVAKKNVEQLEKLAVSVGLPEGHPFMKSCLRLVGCLKRMKNTLRDASRTAQIAAEAFSEKVSIGEWHPDERIGLSGESLLFLLIEQMADPENLDAALLGLRILRDEILPNLHSDKEMIAANPNIRNNH